MLIFVTFSQGIDAFIIICFSVCLSSFILQFLWSDTSIATPKCFWIPFAYNIFKKFVVKHVQHKLHHRDNF